MNSRRGLILLAMVFVVLVGVLLIQQVQQAAPTIAPTPTGSYTPVFSGWTADDIQAVRLRSPETGNTFLLSRAADGSWAAPEISGSLDAHEASIIVQTMVLMAYSSVLPMPAKAELPTYGFTPEGVLSVEILLTSGDTHVVAVGFRTISEQSYYALVDNSTELYLLQRPAVDYLISRLRNPPVA